MHTNNQLWLADLQKNHPTNFTHARVLELGSGGADLTVRSFFTDCAYTGVDVAAGVGVDIAIPAMETAFTAASFDTIISLSMFEHDPTWRESLRHNVPWLAPVGLLILCWGAEGNLHHGPEPWKPVPAADVIALVKDLGLDVLDHFNEEDRYGKNCAGAYDLIARYAV